MIVILTDSASIKGRTNAVRVNALPVRKLHVDIEAGCALASLDIVISTKRRNLCTEISIRVISILTYQTSIWICRVVHIAIWDCNLFYAGRTWSNYSESWNTLQTIAIKNICNLAIRWELVANTICLYIKAWVTNIASPVKERLTVRVTLSTNAIAV